jgi:hypothetical protein
MENWAGSFDKASWTSSPQAPKKRQCEGEKREKESLVIIA